MPLFKVEKNTVSKLEQQNFPTEKVLQQLVEANLATMFGCRFVASEFPTGARHGGRIDTLALSEDNNPVIIEYKKVESSSLINQSLFYLSWLFDHRGDFEIAAQKSLGPKYCVDWSDARVICLAPQYPKYDLHAVQVMGATIELWTYRMYASGIFFIEEVLQKAVAPEITQPVGKNPVMVAAGKKAAATRLTGTYTFEQHIQGKPPAIRELAMAVQEYLTGLDPAIEEAPKKLYIAYKISENILCMEVHQHKVCLFLKLDPRKEKWPAGIFRDVSSIGHFGTGDLEVTLRSLADLEVAKPFIERAYRAVGA